MKKKTVLFICSFNSVRSQMAEGFLKARCKDHYTVFSAGIAPAGLNPYAVAVMKEAGIDISTQKSKQIAQFRGTRFDFVITLCDRAKKAVPKSLPKGETIIHHGFVSPSDIQENKEQVLEDFRTLREDIDAWLTVIFPDCPDNRRNTGGASNMTEHLRERSAYNPVNENIEGTLKKTRVLFICTHNSARSQMAEGYLRKHYGDLFEAGSAGTGVRTVHPLAVLVMDEIGIDISGYRSKLIDEFFDHGADIVVTVCDSVTNACPFFPGAKTVLHAGFPDPSACTGTPDECVMQFRQVRDAIIAWIDTTLVPEYWKKGTFS